VADGGGLEKGPNPRAMIKSRTPLIGILPCLRAESWSQDARRPVQPGLMRSKERRASADQSRTNRRGHPGPAPSPAVDLLAPLHHPRHACPRLPRRGHRDRTRLRSHTRRADRADRQGSAGSSTRSSSARSTASTPCSPGHDGADDTKPAPANATTTTTTAVGSNDHELRLQ
jgi:hypothetical protein